MKLILHPRASLRTARRLIRPSGYRLTVRFGVVYTVRAVPQRQPHTPAQLTARAIFAEANRIPLMANAKVPT